MLLSDLVGIKFSDDGESPESGFDCYGLVIYVYREFYNIEIPSYKHNKIEPLDSKKIERQIVRAYNSGNWIKIDEPEEPNLVTIKNHPVFVNHIGVYIGDGKFIHALKKVGVIISSINDRFWKPKIVGFYRWKE